MPKYGGAFKHFLEQNYWQEIWNPLEISNHSAFDYLVNRETDAQLPTTSRHQRDNSLLQFTNPAATMIKEGSALKTMNLIDVGSIKTKYFPQETSSFSEMYQI